jgi:CDP-diacylglycerol--glycerol-3-phosphate 3-phosphatidyltransferase
MCVRMALNAIDGMLAREFGQKSKLGAYLNEVCDVVSDAALFMPFALIVPFTWFDVALVVFLATISEFVGVLGLTVGASRRYDGPMGKSDRAFVFGALGLWVGIAGGLPVWLSWLMPVLSALLVVTILNRMNRALAESN